MNYWNSEDHPNCINLFVSATPWNLNTTKSKFNKSTIIAYNKSTKKMEFIDQQTVSSEYTKKSSLHDIRLSNLEYKERKVRLMVSSPFSPLKTSKFIVKWILGHSWRKVETCHKRLMFSFSNLLFFKFLGKAINFLVF